MYVPGYPPHPFPLSRHLPPLAEGVAISYAEMFTAPGDIVIDPFGQSPRVALELVRQGRSVILATNNPVLRLALGAALDPIPTGALRSVLTRIADSRMANERVESYVRHIYRSTCPDCSSPVEVDSFGWERETLVEKSYHCETCGGERTRPADAADSELANRVPARGPHFHWALDRVTPTDDADRPLFGEALEAYTPRALSVLFTLTLKGLALDLNEAERRALEVLLLMAFDEGLSLPSAGQRPRTLKPHVRFTERNIWLTLERLVRDGSWQSDGGAWIPIRPLNQIAETPGVVIHDGSIRDLAKSLRPQSIPCMISALPRPNLVLWTLSTVWAGWLWGEPAARQLRQLIRRRRYDWTWHEHALRSSFSAAQTLLRRGGRFVALLPEAEAGFVAAALVAADGANYALIQQALRNDPAEAQLIFQPDGALVEPPDDLSAALRECAEDVANRVLQERGEPSRWNSVSGAIYTALAREHLLRLAVEETVNEPLNYVEDTIEAACLKSRRVLDLKTEDTEADTIRAANGIWWLAEPGGTAAPLADRTEHEVARALAAAMRTGIDWAALDKRVCEALPGLTLPGGALIRRCLESYGQERDGLWFFRPEDNPMDRANDFEQILADLGNLGRRLNYELKTPRGGEVEWYDARKQAPAYQFFVTDTAEIGQYVLIERPNVAAKRVIVIPGGRAGLIDYKVKRDPRLSKAIDKGNWLFVKYRHIRRLLAEPGLDPVDLLTVLNRDPITEQKSTQLPLL